MIERILLKRTDRVGFREEAPLDLSGARVRGKERIVICPFHPDSSPSLWVNLDKFCFHCFACEASGVVAAESTAGWIPPILPSPKPPKPSPAPELVAERDKLLSDALGYYQLHLHQAADYLQQRMVCLETVRSSGGGFCPYTIEPFLNYMKEKGWTSLAPLLRHFLIRQTSSGRFASSMQGRVVFPLTHQGKISSLAGRHLHGKSQELKWLFLKSIQEIPKGIFGEQNLNQPRVILTESIFDALPWLERERPAVALMGVHLPKWVSERLRGKEVYFALNGDEAGEKATKNQLKRLDGVAREVRLIPLPSGYKDWNEYHCQRSRALGLGLAGNR